MDSTGISSAKEAATPLMADSAPTCRRADGEESAAEHDSVLHDIIKMLSAGKLNLPAASAVICCMGSCAHRVF
jgi:hypothetical protein